jgi:hypothetical protein
VGDCQDYVEGCWGYAGGCLWDQKWGYERYWSWEGEKYQSLWERKLLKGGGSEVRTMRE